MATDAVGTKSAMGLKYTLISMYICSTRSSYREAPTGAFIDITGFPFEESLVQDSVVLKVGSSMSETTEAGET